MVMKPTDFKLSREKNEVLSRYLAYKRTSVNCKSKMDNYRYFESLFLSNSNKELKEYGDQELIDFINFLKNKGYSTGTINEIKWMVKSFICWYYDDFPKRFRNMDRILSQQKKNKTYSPDQMLTKKDIEKLVQEEKETRWKAFFLIYFYGGFRPIEVCKLEWKNITYDIDGCYIKVYSNKNHKEFQKFIPEEVSFYLKKLQNNNSKYVFPTKRTNLHGIPVGDNPMTTSGVYQHLIPLAKRVLNKHVNPYILRHSIATILYNRDDLKDDDVAQQLGHSKAMKETYNNLSLDKIRQRMKKIWIKPEDLPEKKKHELEKQIDDLRITILALTEIVNNPDVEKKQKILNKLINFWNTPNDS